MPLASRRSNSSRSSEGEQSSIAPVILVLASLLKRSGNVTYYDQLGLSSVSWSIIARLGEEGAMTQTELAEKMILDKGQLSRAVVDLESKRLVSRVSRPRRSIELRLMPEGRRVFAAIQRISKARHRALLAGIDRRDVRVLYKTLAQIKVNADVLLNQVKPAQP